jgi:hypothetical protein
MKHLAAILATAAIAALSSAASLAADPSTDATVQASTDATVQGSTDATIEYRGGSAALGLGYTWADGTLTYKGRSYPVRLSAFTVGDVGGEGITGSGVIHNLVRLEDFEGTYGGGGAGLTVGVGGNAQALRNEHGVTMYLAATSVGLKVNLSLDGVVAHRRNSE